MRRTLIVALLAGLGCKAGGGGSGAGISEARMRLESWMAASWRAHDTRTHASDETVKAQAEANRIEAELKAAAPADVRVALRDRRASTQSAREASEQRRNGILVAGRAHTEQDKAELEALAVSTRRFEQEDAMLADLGKRLGL